jgi:hypothetical protein
MPVPLATRRGVGMPRSGRVLPCHKAFQLRQFQLGGFQLGKPTPATVRADPRVPTLTARLYRKFRDRLHPPEQPQSVSALQPIVVRRNG